MDTWYYSRSELAGKYLQTLKVGISSNLAIIAPRRKGKTLFMLHDIATLAKKKGYIPVYASLWQDINTPQEGLISALQEAIEALDKKITISNVLKAKINKASLGNDLIGRVEMEFADNPKKPTNTDLVLVDQHLPSVPGTEGSAGWWITFFLAAPAKSYPPLREFFKAPNCKKFRRGD